MIGRIFRLVRTPVTLLVLLGVLLYGAWWGYHNIIRPVPELPPEPCVQQSVTKGQLKPALVAVRVFNGGDRKGLATDVSRQLRAKGFRVGLTSNTVEKIQRTVIVGTNADDPEVLFVKTFFKDATVRAHGRPDHSVDVLVGNRYGGFNPKAKTTYDVTTPTVCLPSQAPTATPVIGG